MCTVEAGKRRMERRGRVRDTIIHSPVLRNSHNTLRRHEIETGILRQARWFLFSSMFCMSQASEFLFSTGKLRPSLESWQGSDPAACSLIIRSVKQRSSFLRADAHKLRDLRCLRITIPYQICLCKLSPCLVGITEASEFPFDRETRPNFKLDFLGWLFCTRPYSVVCCATLINIKTRAVLL